VIEQKEMPHQKKDYLPLSKIRRLNKIRSKALKEVGILT